MIGIKKYGDDPHCPAVLHSLFYLLTIHKQKLEWSRDW
jgi:hypothetical protein